MQILTQQFPKDSNVLPKKLTTISNTIKEKAYVCVTFWSKEKQNCEMKSEPVRVS